jgi:Kef-type K+ transport system membrane component KefB/mannitol/fructose-specific phosphotransferase system IIA component (Ntr-type)
MDVQASLNVITEHHLLLFLIQFFLLLGSAKLLGLLFTKFKQPTVTADILVGVFFGPSLLGRLFPGVHGVLFPRDPFQISMLDTVAWIGIFFLLLVTGLEVNFSSVWKHKGKALTISIADIIIPIVISAAVIYFLPDRFLVDPQRRLLFTLFISTIMTISALPVSIRAMQDMKLLRTELGFLTISALSINDVIGWVVFTIILGVFTHGRAELGMVSILMALTGVFIFTAATLGKRAVSGMLGMIRDKSTDSTGSSLTVIALVGLGFGAIAQKIGIHALFGFFLAGLIAGETRDLSEKTRAIIAQMVYAVFVPIFFANIGLKIDVLNNFDLLLVVLFSVVGIGARFIGAYVGVVWAKVPQVQRWPISILHTPGGAMHIVVATLALGLKLITQQVYVAIVIAAVLSSVILGPWLALIIKRIMPRETVQIRPDAAMAIEAVDKFDALQQLCKKAVELRALSFDSIYEVSRGREEGMSTGVGKAIAMPHARLEGLAEPLVVVGRCARGIDWDSPDGVAVQLIFFSVTPADQPQEQLRIYSELLRVLDSDEERQAIIEAPTLAQAVEMLNTQLRVATLGA